MARVTIEDCMTKIPNKFELVCLAAKRAEAISCGAPITVDRDNDKNAVVALREIAADKIDIEHLRTSLIMSLQTRNKVDMIEEENLYAEHREDVAEEFDLEDDSVNILDHGVSDFGDIEFEDYDIDDKK